MNFALDEDLAVLARKFKASRKIKKAIARACIVALSDVDFSSSSGDSSSSEEEARPKGKKKNKDFTRLCFMAHGNEELSDSDTSEVETHESLTYRVEQLDSALVKQDNLLRVASSENKDLKSKLENFHWKLRLPGLCTMIRGHLNVSLALL